MSNALTSTALTRLPTLKLEDDRIIIGALLKYIDNRQGWQRHDGIPLRQGAQYLGLGTRRALQRFVDRRPEIITAKVGEELPDVDEMNTAIPKEQWPIGLTGESEPPWKYEHIVYMIDVIDLTILTYSNHTVGAARAVSDLEDRWEWAKALYGADVMPLFTLDEAPFPTGYGERKRPLFKLVGWRHFTCGALHAIDQGAVALATPAKKPLSTDLNDSIPH